MQQVQSRILWGRHEAHRHCLPALPMPLHRCLPQVRPSSGCGREAESWIQILPSLLSFLVCHECSGLHFFFRCCGLQLLQDCKSGTGGQRERVTPPSMLWPSGQQSFPGLAVSGLVPSPAPCPAHLVPTDSQTLASWTRMVKPRVMHVPLATQVAAVRGESQRAGGGIHSIVEEGLLTPLSPPAVPLGTRATPSSPAGSASLPVSMQAPPQASPQLSTSCLSPPQPLPGAQPEPRILESCLSLPVLTVPVLCLSHSHLPCQHPPCVPRPGDCAL